MGMFIYCPRKSTGAMELVHALPAKRLRKFDGIDFWDKRNRMKLTQGDIVICWGAPLPEFEGLRVLNGAGDYVGKKEEVNILANHGVETVQVYPVTNEYLGHPKMLHRSNYHIGGNDILGKKLMRPDYLSYKMDFVKEYRIHSFNGKSIRAGIKVPREGFTPVTENLWKPDSNMAHPWIRSFDGGWRINYDGFSSNNLMKSVAHKAVSALGLHFGAVDIGETADGTMIVLEVNRAPGIEGNSIQSYVRAINRWIENGNQPEGPKQKAGKQKAGG